MSTSVEPVIDKEDGKVTGPRGAKAFKKWEPKEWRPEYEAMVALSCTGLANKDVGARFGYGAQQVSNILNTIQGKKLKEIIKERIRLSTIESAHERMGILQDNAMKNIETIIADEDNVIKTKAPLALFDRSLQILKATGAIKSDTAPLQQNGQPLIGSVGTINHNTMVLSPEAAALLNEGSAKADMVKKLHGGPVTVVPKP